MPRALLAKSWRQLRMLRFAGVALLAATPVATLLLAEAARRGWLPSGRVGDYDTAVVLHEGAPGLLVAALALVTLMFAAQAFSGDRAADTEAFVLTRPVPRSRTWWTRAAAALGSSAVVAALGGLAWLATLEVAGVGVPRSGERSLVLVTAVVVGVILAALLAGAAAAAFLDAPLAVLLLGAILLFVPLGLGGFLVRRFPLAALHRVPIGGVVPVLLFPAFGVASWLAACRGEPVGRGRRARAAIALVAGAVVVSASFLVGAPLAVRYAAASDGDVLASPVAGRALLESWGAPWALRSLDPATGARSRILATVCTSAEFSPDGRRFAVLTAGGPFGAMEAEGRIEIFDAARLEIERTVSLSRIYGAIGFDYGVVPRMFWTHHGILVAVVEVGIAPGRTRTLARSTLVRVDPGTGAVTPLAIEGATDAILRTNGYLSWQGVPGGTPYVVAPAESRTTVYRIDEASSRAVLRPILDDAGHVAGGRDALAPSGRFWVVSPPSFGDHRTAPLRVRDLTHGADSSPTDAPIHPGEFDWIAGDRLVWAEHDGDATRLRTWKPVEEAREIGSYEASDDVVFDRSPDGARTLVVLVRRVPRSGSRDVVRVPVRALVVGPDGTPPAELHGVPPPYLPIVWWWRIGWADPVTVAWVGDEPQRFVALEPIERPGELVWVDGGP